MNPDTIAGDPMGFLRLLLALAVVAAHAGPAFGWQWLRMTDGPRSVQAFYAVSGFYMTLVLHEKYVGQGTYGVFLRARLLRLYPLYAVVAAATVVAGLLLQIAGVGPAGSLARWQAAGAGLAPADTALLVASNALLLGQDALCFAAFDPATGRLGWHANAFAQAAPAWQFMLVPQAWTVCVELMFYVVAPLLVRRPVWLLAGLALLSYLARAWTMRTFGVGWDPWTYRFFPFELAHFLLGALACRGYFALRARDLLPRPLCRAGLAAALALPIAAPHLGDEVWKGHYGAPGLVPVLACLLPFVFAATRSSRLDRAVGELSYPVYLVHFLCLDATSAIGSPWLAAHRGEVVAAASLLLAALLWRCVGAPLEGRRAQLAAG